MSDPQYHNTEVLPPVEPPGAMGALWDEVIAVAEALGPHDWDKRVPWCPDWNVADLISHLGGLQSALNGAPQPPTPEGFEAAAAADRFSAAMAPAIAARREWDPQQRLDELRTASDAHVATLAAAEDWAEPTVGPAGATTQIGLHAARSFDVWVHLQDLREALGQPVSSDDRSPAAAAAHLFVLNAVPWMFVKRAGAQEGATLRVTLGPPLDHDNVLSVVDGRARWDPEADPGDCVITATPAALTLLLARRGTAQRWRDEGVLSWHGPRAAEFVERAGMF